MKEVKSIILLSIAWILLILSSCVDEDLRRHEGYDGMAMVSLQTSFSPFAEGNLTRASNVAPARGFNTLSDIALLVFDEDGRLLPDYLKEVLNPAVTDENRGNEDAAYGSTAESDTKKVDDLPLLIPYGTYYIVAVANYGEYQTMPGGTISIKEDENGNKISSLTKIMNQIDDVETFTLEDLRGLKTTWDHSDYANNRAMMGFFTTSDIKPHAGSKFETVTIDRTGLKPHAWLRRCASKITVDFDGSGLRDNVSIFIKDIRIYDIAKDCTLGFGNPISDDEDGEDFNNRAKSISDLTQRPDDASNEQYIEFGESNYADEWPRISRQTPYIMDADGTTRKNLHTQNSECLYFFENLQGTKENYDRSPKPNLTQGGLEEGYNEKDGVPFGTYIEVSARYVMEADGEIESHDMKYRFMIGKNAIDNFDAERNFHYKLTLAFNGTANEYHWHIDYSRDEGFKVPNPWYVSYVYNHDAYLPYEFTVPNDDWEVADMDAEIETNPWYPTTNLDDFAEGNDLNLTDPDYEINPFVPDGDESYPYLNNPQNRNNCNGFLSLRAPSDETILTDKRIGFSWSGYNSTVLTNSEKYYNGEQAGTDTEGNPVEKKNLGKRSIIKDAQLSDSFTEREALSVKKENGIYNISIPLFTREKALVKQTGYTGNNPFVGYQRVAKVKLTAKAWKKNDHNEIRNYEARVNVVQVRRVVNPKGVYRKNGNNEPFHVNLKFLTSERADGEFKSIISRGPWIAEVLGDKNFITLDGKQRVSGSSRSEIDFTIRFNRMGGSGNKNAIVRIKYHNYTCTHLIFVRQGYDPQAICGGGRVYENPNAPATVWNTFNMTAGNVMATDPRDEGSMFKFGNPYNCISSISNIYTDSEGNPIFYEQSREGFTPHQTLRVLMSDGNINTVYNTWTGVGANVKPDFTGTDMEISNAATMRDFEQLYLTKYVEFGYGVLYADGATETQSSLGMVNGWYRDDTSPDKNKKGMRGVFAYYWNPNDENVQFNTRNIFFPIGRSGYGHRKNAKEDQMNNNNKGILRYSCNRPLPAASCGVQTFQIYAPLMEFLYRRMGAIYWSRTKTGHNAFLTGNGEQSNETSVTEACGIDFNYFTFDVNAINYSILNNGQDACFVRTVARSASD